jgi:hypothetical protein
MTETTVNRSDLVKQAIEELGTTEPVSYVNDVLTRLREKNYGEEINERMVREVVSKQMGNQGLYSVKRQQDNRLVILNNKYKVTNFNGFNLDESWLENRAEEMREGVIRKLTLEDLATAVYDRFEPEKVLPVFEGYFRSKGLDVSYDKLEGVMKVKPTGFDFVHKRARTLINNRYKYLCDERDELQKKEENKEKVESKNREIRFLQWAISAEKEETTPPIWRLKRPLISKSTLSEKEKEHFVGQISYWLGKDGGKFTAELEQILGKTFFEVRHSLEVLAALPEAERDIKHCPFSIIEPGYECVNLKEGALVEKVDTTQLVRLSEFGEEYKALALEGMRKHGQISIGDREFKISLPGKQEINVYLLDKKVKKDNEPIGFESAIKAINDSWKNYRYNFLL